MTLEVKPWKELSRKEINDIFSLRSEVFIVEQECAYQDVDGKDKQADHVMLHVDNELVGYTRVFVENTYFKEASFGRAVVKKNHRGEGYGHLLVDKSLEHLKSKKQSPIKISAQSYLKEFLIFLMIEKVQLHLVLHEQVILAYLRIYVYHLRFYHLQHLYFLVLMHQNIQL